MLVTIYTDASYHPPTDKAGGAAWIRSEDGLIKYHKSFTAVNSSHAEALVALKAIKQAYEEWEHSSVMFVNTDSLSLCKCVWPFTDDEGTKDFGKVVDQIISYCDENDLESRFKHVKAHQSKDKDIRSFLNFWCDKYAGLNRQNNYNSKTLED